jgi:hypothetical protein
MSVSRRVQQAVGKKISHHPAVLSSQPLSQLPLHLDACCFALSLPGQWLQSDKVHGCHWSEFVLLAIELATTHAQKG